MRGVIPRKTRNDTEKGQDELAGVGVILPHFLPCFSVYSVDSHPTFFRVLRVFRGRIVAKAVGGELECGPADSALGPRAESAFVPAVVVSRLLRTSLGLPMP